jgi:hypothetical protein
MVRYTLHVLISFRQSIALLYGIIMLCSTKRQQTTALKADLIKPQVTAGTCLHLNYSSLGKICDISWFQELKGISTLGTHISLVRGVLTVKTCLHFFLITLRQHFTFSSIPQTGLFRNGYFPLKQYTTDAWQIYYAVACEGIDFMYTAHT